MKKKNFFLCLSNKNKMLQFLKLKQPKKKTLHNNHENLTQSS